MPNLADIATFLNTVLDSDRYPPDERAGIYVSTARPIRRLGLALDATEDGVAGVGEVGERGRNSGGPVIQQRLDGAGTVEYHRFGGARPVYVTSVLHWCAQQLGH